LAIETIMGSVFAPPPEPVKGVEVGGQLVNPMTGEVIYAGQPDPGYRLTTPEEEAMYGGKGQISPDGKFEPLAGNSTGYIASGEQAAGLGLDPNFSYNITSGPNGMKADKIGPARTGGPPETRQVKLPDGSEALVEWDDETSSWLPAKIPEGGTGAQPTAKLTELQAKTQLFGSLQSETAPVLDQIETQWDPTNLPDAAARAVPIAGNFFQSAQGQIYQTAASAWAEGAIRLVTGAAATDEEVTRTVRTYFAQPGDTPATVAFKSQMRQMYMRAVDRSLGKSVPGSLMLPDDFAAIVAPADQMSREEALKLLEQ
jgi:hypothetical protein